MCNRLIIRTSVVAHFGKVAIVLEVDTEAYLLVSMRYIELNPVRAGMVAHPRD